MNSNDNVVFMAVGDVFSIRSDPETSFALSASTIKTADIAFCQLEKILSTKEQAVYYNALVNNPADVARALANSGFDVVGVASNHHMDAGVGPFLDTI